MNRSLVSLLVLGSALAASPALAHDHGGQGAMPPSPPQGVYQGTWQGGAWTGQWLPAQPGAYPQAPYPQAPYPAQPMGYPAPDARTQEMMDRCLTYKPDNGVGGALIGGVVGGVLGNRIASGNRTLGTVAGAAVGAIAGTAIDKAEDKGKERECRDFWASQPQTAVPPVPYGYPGYGYGYAAMPVAYMMVPVPQAPAKPCVETKTVTYEYVSSPRRRYIPARPHHDKRVKEKRVYTGS